MAYHVDDTIAAVASATGGAARGIVRLSGPATIECLRACFQLHDDQQLPVQHAARITGRLSIGDPIGPLDCQLYVWPTQRSYTRQPAAEIHTFGSAPILDAALKTLCQHGARLAEPGEFTLRAFLAGRLDLTQAEAVLGVIDATNQQQLDVSLTQLAGGLSGRLNELRDRLLNLCADLEAGLDFVEEDIEFVSAEQTVRQLTEVVESIESILGQMQSRGESHFTPRIVLRGRPNAGKSTLWNALATNRTAITSDAPGTTRDYLEGEIDIVGTRCCLIDTAGIDDQSPSSIDLAAQQMSAKKHEQATVDVFCVDGSAPMLPWDAEQLHDPKSPDLVVLTKVDAIAEAWRSGPAQFGFEASTEPPTTFLRHRESGQGIKCLHVSCHANIGIQLLVRGIHAALQSKLNHESSVVAATSARCHESLRRAMEDAVRARQLASIHAGDELVVAEVRNALSELGTVVGAVYTEDVLDRIFSRFCIGK